MKKIPNDLFFDWVETEIAKGHSVRFRLKGHSMFPLLRNGKDEVVLYPCTEKELSPMDIVLFKYKGKHLLHRILHKDGNCLLIQGDGSYFAKEECVSNDVIGKVHLIIRPSGKIQSVNDWSWKSPSFLWQKTRFIRPFLLRFLSMPSLLSNFKFKKH